MIINNSNRTSRRRGVALVYAVFGSFVMAGMVGVMFTMAGVSNTTANTSRHRTQASYLAEGAVEAAKKEVQEAIANWRMPAESGSIVIDGYNVTYTIEPAGANVLLTDPAGIQTILNGFEVEAIARVDGSQAVAHRVVNMESTPLFQFAVFYTNDLEVHPGPDMTLGGRVHSNGDMYLGSGATLTLDTNYVRALGDIYRRRKHNDDSNGNVEIRKWVANPFDPAQPFELETMLSQSQLDPVLSASGYDSVFDGWDENGDGDYDDPGDWLPFLAGALEMWGPPDLYPVDGHTVLTGAHGVSEAVTPDVGSIQMYEKVSGGDYIFNPTTEEYELTVPGMGTHDPGFYHDNADVTIIVSADGSSIWLNGTDVSADSAYDGIISYELLYDARQADGSGENTPVLKVDLDLLREAGVWPQNGLLYAAHYGMGEGVEAKGILLTNGSELASGLTIATEGAAYIHGDYNVVDKKGASVIADAVNLLSNAWDGTKASGDLPGAAETTYNCAVITGNYETEESQYNGGLENLPRFHEAWSGVPCNIEGSFVNAWESTYATGLWQYGGDRYKAPGRNWAYDQMFNQVGNLPPFTPVAVTAVDAVSW